MAVGPCSGQGQSTDPEVLGGGLGTRSLMIMGIIGRGEIGSIGQGVPRSVDGAEVAVAGGLTGDSSNGVQDQVGGVGVLRGGLRIGGSIIGGSTVDLIASDNIEKTSIRDLCSRLTETLLQMDKGRFFCRGSPKQFLVLVVSQLC